MTTEQAVQTVGRISSPVQAGPPLADASNVAPISLDDRLREFEASWIQWALTISRGNKSKAARLLKIKRSTLGDRIKRCGLGAPTEEPLATGTR